MSEVTDSTGVDISKLDKYSVFYLIPLPRRDVLNKSQSAVLGTRQTVIQGYTRPLEYYSPAYPTKELYMDKVDKRRTLYWNPSVQADENGKAVIECYNNQYSTPLIIQAETLGKRWTDRKYEVFYHWTNRIIFLTTKRVSIRTRTF